METGNKAKKQTSSIHFQRILPWSCCGHYQYGDDVVSLAHVSLVLGKVVCLKGMYGCLGGGGHDGFGLPFKQNMTFV